MRQSRFVLFAAVVAILAMSAAPALAVACSCHFCRPGNLTAKCDWNGYWWAYCVDYWEANCMTGGGGGFLAATTPAEGESCVEPAAEGDLLATILAIEVDTDEETEAEAIAVEPKPAPQPTVTD